MDEVWEVVPFAPFYQASSLGRIRSMDRIRDMVSYGTTWSRAFKGRVLKTPIGSRGYALVSLSIGTNKAKQFSVHRIVAITFLNDKREELQTQVNHKNGIRADNRVENLEWVTPSENVLHGYRSNGRIAPQKGSFGKDHAASIPIIGTHIIDGTVLFFDSTATAGRSGYCATNIHACISGKRKTHKQMTWRKAETNED